ncbi:response regulator transcription factor [Streptomyces sp. TLI_185]|uniref:response regulator n=1 Tax=Streptomyces sp. TLI_185 TaxID=2485151 RepID=UPI0021A538A8|nr:response regulator transcription factor [Streptomyces sp. TLI_185]
MDDHAGFRAFARALLEAEGFDVVGEAADGASALYAAERLDPQIVLLDIVLPDLDGFEVCARLTGRGRQRPAVVLTSSRDATAYTDRLSRSAARGFIPKDRLSGTALLALAG